MGARSEVAQVGVERLGAGDGQDHGAKGQEADPAMAGRKLQRQIADSTPQARRGLCICARPRMASTTNQKAMIGPKQAPMPRFRAAGRRTSQ